MAISVSKERRVKRLERQIKQHKNNPKLVANLENRIKTLKSK